ncbi:MAG: signal peptide peptidase SppA [Candidatus Zixiibacteriota bacterium]|nr:MAG: signal peptide peptidase SppA [candidate division Zixibacteria bacterium]
MARLALMVILLSVLLYSFSAGGIIDGIEYQSESVATSTLVSSGLINPAGLGFFTAMGLRYSHSFSDSSFKGDNALMISSRRGFFGLEWLNHTEDIFRRKFTLALGDRLLPNFYAGMSYSWFNGNPLFKKIKLWKIGLLYHPFPKTSLGFIADRINEPEFSSIRQKRLYRPGIAFRPYRDKVTLSSDLRWIEGQNPEELSGNFRVEVLPFSRFHFSAEYATEGMWRFGVVYDFEKTKTGAQGRLDRSQNYSGGSFFIELSALNYSSYLGSRKTGYVILDRRIVEETTVRSLFASPGRPFYKIILSLRKSAADAAIERLIIKIDGARFSLASAQEIRNAIIECRKRNKEVIVFLKDGSNLSYYMASAANKIVMSPSGYLDLRGLYATATFYTGSMEKLGIKAQVIKSGPHKTYGDAFTEEGLTDEAREQLNWLMDDLYEQFMEDISNGRRLTSTEIRDIIDKGPYTAKDAFEIGLVDKLAYYDDLIDDMVPRPSGMVDIYRHFNEDYYNSRWSEPKRIAIVYANGSIRPGESGRSFWEGRIAGSSTISKALRSVRRDSNIKAVVLRVNSPGGDLFGTDDIYRQMELLKGKKPLVVSMGGVAASGGYYISMAGDDVLASPSTITGSIGVVVGKPDMTGLYEKIGLKKETIRRGDHSDIRSFDRPATAKEIELVERQVDQYYNDFINKVSQWRKIDVDSIKAIAGGRVWTGNQALDRGLIDSYGGIWEAIELARNRAGIDREDKLIIKTYPEYRFTLFDAPVTSILEDDFTYIAENRNRSGFSLRLPYDLKIE